MRKAIIPIFMMLLMVSFASAGLTTLSGSRIDFSTSDGDFQEAYLLSVVENGGSDKIYFADFPEPGTGYTKESNSGYITGELTKMNVEYPFTQRYAYVHNMIRLNGGNTKTAWGGWPDAQQWCLSLGGDIAAKDGTLSKLPGNYYCFKVNEIGNIGDISTPRYNWAERITVYNRVSGESYQTEYITIDGSTGETSSSYEYSPNRKIRVKFAFTGGSLTSNLPQIQSNYDMWYSGGNVQVIEEFPNTANKHSSWSATLNAFGEAWLGKEKWYDFYVLGKSGFFPSAELDPLAVERDINNYNSNRIVPTSIREIDWSTANIDQNSGTITMQRTDGQFPIAPVFTMKIDAEWIGIDEPRGKPVIETWEAKGNEFIEGDSNAGFNAVVRNDGDDSSFQYILTCTPSTYVTIDRRNQESYASGQTKSFSVRAFANTAGQNINAQCCLEVKDYSHPEITSGKQCDSITFLEANQCPDGMDAGHSKCGANDEILQCLKNNDGVLVLQSTGQICQYGCSQEGERAVCSAPPTCTEKYETGMSCGDGICESFERIGRECECLDDCSPCGDGYCSKSEDETDSCPQDCGTDPYCGDGICGINEYGIKETESNCKADCGKPNPDTPWALIVFGIVGGGGLAAAIGLRLKKEGYFGK